MRISEILKSSTKPFPSLEIVPPLNGIDKKDLFSSIEPLMEFSPKYINVTQHRDELEFVQNPDGTFTRHTVRSRVSQVAVAGALMSRFNVEVVPHIICAGAGRDEINNQLDDMKFLGIENVMALRGDCLTSEKRFAPHPEGYRWANELVSGIREYRKSEGNHFCIGVGAYPEKHFEAPNLETDIENLKKKIDAGADFIITQMFYDNTKFFTFADKCRKAGIEVPIIPGLKILTSKKQLRSLPESFSLDIPVELSREMEKAGDDRDYAASVGVEWCTMQCRELLSKGYKVIHFYTMGRSTNVSRVMKNCF